MQKVETALNEREGKAKPLGAEIVKFQGVSCFNSLDRCWMLSSSYVYRGQYRKCYGSVYFLYNYITTII